MVHFTVVSTSARVILKMAQLQTNMIDPVIYRIAHLSLLSGFMKIENHVSAQ